MHRTKVVTTPDTDVVIEWAPFTLKDGISEKTLLQASNAVQKAFLEKQRGYIRRELFKGEDKQWVDLVYWESNEDAQRAIQGAAESAMCLSYFEMMASIDQDDLGKGVSHYQRMALWE